MDLSAIQFFVAFTSVPPKMKPNDPGFLEAGVLRYRGCSFFTESEFL